VIPSHLQGLLPTQEDRTDWLWLSSRLAFHFRRASASLLPSAASYLAAPNEVAEELGGKAKKEGMHIRRRKKRTWRNIENGFCGR